jgi:hypothetical protein
MATSMADSVYPAEINKTDFVLLFERLGVQELTRQIQMVALPCADLNPRASRYLNTAGLVSKAWHEVVAGAFAKRKKECSQRCKNPVHALHR